MYYIDNRTINGNYEVINKHEDREDGFVTLFAARAVFKQLAGNYGIICPPIIRPNEWYTSSIVYRYGIREQMRIIEVK